MSERWPNERSEESFPRREPISRGFGGGGNRTHEPFPREFSLRVPLAGVEVEVKREGKHVNLHLTSDDPGFAVFANFESLQEAYPKLKALVFAAELLLEEH